MTTGETFGYFLVRDTSTQPLPLPGLDSDRIAVVRGQPGLEQTYWASLHAGGGGIGIVADGVWNSLSGATVALGSDTVTVSGAAFTSADVGKRFTMLRGGSPVSFAGGDMSAIAAPAIGPGTRSPWLERRQMSGASRALGHRRLPAAVRAAQRMHNLSLRGCPLADVVGVTRRDHRADQRERRRHQYRAGG